MLKEFKEFISRGNVIDLAVGVVMGSAFSSIVTSLVDDIIMPIVGLIIGGIDFSNMAFKISGVYVKYGSFIQNIVNFLIIAASIFMFVKLVNKISRKKEEEKQEEKKDDPTVKLLEEIRDTLKKNTSK